MRRPLKLHPQSVCTVAAGVEVEITRPTGGSLLLSYTVTGTIDDLLLPPIGAPARADELWQHTCFEAFVREAASEGYYEFNFAPSTQWAAYRFDRYRRGMQVATEIECPQIVGRSVPERYTLRATFSLPDRQRDRALGIGLAAVLEETNGNRSYWALTHPAGAPDFHHADGFVLELALAEGQARFEKLALCAETPSCRENEHAIKNQLPDLLHGFNVLSLKHR